jgi:hypothetical protein
VLLEPAEGWLFSGDFYVGNLKVFRRGENIYQQIEAARHILTHDFDTLFCGHRPVQKKGKAAIERKMTYLQLWTNRLRCSEKAYPKPPLCAELGCAKIGLCVRLPATMSL